MAIGAIIVFLIGIGVFLWVSVFSGMLHGGTEPGYRVPNLTGMTVEAARGQEDVVAAQFIITPEAETVANNLPAGQIVSQSPDSGLNAAAGSTITVTISGGPTGDPLAGTKMPNLKNQDKRSAISVLKGLGFDEKSIAIVEENSDEYTKDYIMDQTPAAGEDLEQVEQDYPGGQPWAQSGTGLCDLLPGYDGGGRPQYGRKHEADRRSRG